MKNIIATLGSHSALDICRGAKDEGFKTLVIAQNGREKTYNQYYKSGGKLGCVDECIVVDKFTEILDEKFQKKLKSKKIIFIPHRSFEVYLNFDYDAIENLSFPIFGNKYLLKIEERGRKPNQYDLLDEAGIKYPKQFKDPKKIDRLCIVKVLEKERGFERAFFLVKNYRDFVKESNLRLKNKLITREQFKSAVIEEFVLGVQVNFNFFYSPIHKRLELLGTDTRRQTNLEGITKAPVNYQEEILKQVSVKYEEAGHIAVTVLESLLEDAFDMGERFVKASKVVGPFALQTVITPGPPKKEIIVIDVSPRVPGSPGIFATPYSGYLYGKNLSVGRRIAMEIKEAEKKNLLKKIIS
jgi:5-formaminoimidazole-4-carboxamide-1-(beta)-D-ribofuranosyl 5'-monophosphate synthetase